MRLPIILFLVLSSSLAQARTVSFGGLLESNDFFFNAFNLPSPFFTIGDSYSGSFEIDESVAATPFEPSVNTTQAANFIGAADNLSINIAGSILTGNNGTIIQLLDAGNAGPLVSIQFGGTDFFGGGSFGTVTGSAPNGANLKSIILAVGGTALQDASVVAPAQILRDGFTSLRIDFDRSSLGIDNLDQLNFDATSSGPVGMVPTPVGMVPAPVPVPATVWLVGSGLMGLFGFSKKKTRVS